MEIAAAAGNADIAGKKCQGIDKPGVFTAKPVALQPGADKCGQGSILTIPAPQLFGIRRTDLTGLLL